MLTQETNCNIECSVSDDQNKTFCSTIPVVHLSKSLLRFHCQFERQSDYFEFHKHQLNHTLFYLSYLD